ncbi:alpha-ketoglutarate-dependent dioxygenase AlkB family protein [Silanimonas sp.]|jgi:alkylated DNA repair dioxygenase AlkB|uniref:alpha-ketoglutarate-dependent dioxygenase AlkB family protein n=1 Tax=Silanimonas sp. TaxID=1929290 RepID=UPI0037C6A3D6
MHASPDLFSNDPRTAGGPWEGRVAARPGWLPPDEAEALAAQLRGEVPWTVHRIRMFGRWVDSPRLSCWMGDAEARYRYSGALFEPEPWHPAITALLPRLEAVCDARFNSVLLNRYRDGGDSMGWHSDDEPELGPAPVIASLSLGVERRFLLRMKDDHATKAEFRLRHGDLLVMRGDCQRVAQHALPKMAGVKGERINLTFRWVNPR